MTTRRRGLTVDDLFAVRTRAGAVSNYYGFSRDPNDRNYILGDRFLGKLRADLKRGVRSGGNDQLYRFLTGLGTKHGKDQAFVKKDPKLGRYFKNYFDKGTPLPKNIGGAPAAARAIQAYDYSLRALGRDAVRDREPGLLGKIGKVVGKIAGPAAGFITGNPYIGAVVGGIGGGATGGVKGALFGAAGGGAAGYFSGGVGPFKATIKGAGAAAKANAVPGLSTGVTTPVGGGAIVGTGQAAALNTTGLGGAVLSGARAAASAPGLFGAIWSPKNLTTAGLRVANTVSRKPSKTATAAALAVAGGTAAKFATAGGRGNNNGVTLNATRGADGVYTVNPTRAFNDPEQGYADLTRAQFNLFRDKIKPIESAGLADLRRENLPHTVARSARSQAVRGVDELRGLEARTVQPFGVRLTADDQRVIDRRTGLDRALVGAGAYNTAYGATEDFQLDAAGDALNIGRGIAGGAARGLSSAAGTTANARNAAEAQESQTSQDRLSTVFTGAGVGAALGYTGKLAGIGVGDGNWLGGALVGGGAGLLTSLLL